MSRNRTTTMKRLLSETEKCELCGSKRSLEVHHIVPVSCGGPVDDADNMIVLCVSCHTRLTPRRILATLRRDELRSWNVCCNIYNNFYSKCDKYFKEIASSDTPFSEIDTLCLTPFDVFDEVVNDEMIKVKVRNREISEQELKEYKIDLIHGTKLPLINEKPNNKTKETEQLKMIFKEGNT